MSECEREKEIIMTENGFELVVVPIDVIHSIDDDYVWMYIDNKQVFYNHSMDIATFVKIYNGYIHEIEHDALVVPHFTRYYLQKEDWDISRYDDFRDIPKSMIDY